MTLATDPPVSEAQRRAMFAARAGHSNLGIPQSVGREFNQADKGTGILKGKRRTSHVVNRVARKLGM